MRPPNFIRAPVLCATLLTFLYRSALAHETTAVAPPPMEYVKVCDHANNCHRFSRLILGTDHLMQGGWTSNGQPQLSTEQLDKILDEAVKLGINFIDSAPIYTGGVEYDVGKWIQAKRKEITQKGFYSNPALNPDRKLYALSKGGFPFDLYYSKQLDPGTYSPELLDLLKKNGHLSATPQIKANGAIPLLNVPPGTYASRLYGSKEQIVGRILEELHHSEDNLEGPVTVYLLHRDDGDSYLFKRVPREQTPALTILEALSDPRISSQVGMLGVSNWTPDRVHQLLEAAEAHPELREPLFNSPYFSLFEMSDRTIHAMGVQATHEQMSDPNFEKGIYLNSYSPLGGFSILDQPEPSWENAKKAAKEKFEAGDAYWRNVYPSIFTDENQARYERAVKFTQRFNQAHESHYTVDQMVNAYALAHKRADFLTVGPISVEELRRTVAALPLSHMLTDADLEYLHSGRPWATGAECLENSLKQSITSDLSRSASERK